VDFFVVFYILSGKRWGSILKQTMAVYPLQFIIHTLPTIQRCAALAVEVLLYGYKPSKESKAVPLHAMVALGGEEL
jgi:hypothetical protein